MADAQGVTNLDLLHIGPRLHADLRRFLEQVIQLYGKDLVSVTAFGSCVTSDYVAARSDINLLVLYSELNIADLRRVADLSRRWLSRRLFSPRFLSRRNLLDSRRHFPVDVLAMKDAHVVLWGQDLLQDLAVDPGDMRWQLAHEIKRMRMRIKQQFWRSCNRPDEMRRVLIERYTSLSHLIRALLWLRTLSVPPARGAVMDAAVRELGIPSRYADAMRELHSGGRTPSVDDLIELFTQTMEVIRVVDENVEGSTP